MCGIVGYAGHRPAIPVVVEELHRLVYRGYDSAGVACVQQGAFRVVRAQGKLSALEQLLSEQAPSTATTGMGHTRWATHGAPAVRNAHPHLSNDASLALVHNGIIENYLEIKKGDFYRIESTVDGKRFVTARGWDDLSRMIQVYEKHGLKVDEKLVGQYLQNQKIAKAKLRMRPSTMTFSTSTAATTRWTASWRARPAEKSRSGPSPPSLTSAWPCWA